MISVVICTYNRAASLRQTLDSLRQMSVPRELEWEVVVVDNNSTDDTRRVVEDFARRSSFPVRYVFELRQGLAAARNAGIANSRGEIIAFADDDMLLPPEWLSNIWQEFSLDSELGVLSSRVELADRRDLPLMIIPDTTRRVIWSFLEADGYVGCCWALRRSLVDDVGAFDPVLGAGARFRSAEDVDYVYRVSKKRWKMLYAPSVLSFHKHGRRTPEAEKALLRDYNIGRGAFYAKHLLSGDVFAAKLMYWTVASRARLFLRGRHVAQICRTTGWLIAGFTSYILYRIVCALDPRGWSKTRRPEPVTTRKLADE